MCSEINRNLSIGFSPCPNDTFIFYALMNGKIPLKYTSFQPEAPADVETLNSWAMAGKLDVTKLSFHALGQVMDTYTMLNAGAALGRGCGPLVVAAKQFDPTMIAKKRIAIPGKYTTATLLLKMFSPDCNNLVAMPFHEIMPAVSQGRVDAGLIIHESRFTYQSLGLHKLVDLGSWWEEQTGQPIPLGCIAVKRSLSKQVIQEIDEAIKQSILFARNNPNQCTDYITRHSQELSPKVVADHITLYVNDFSVSLGQEGRAAINEFFHRGKEAGAFPKLHLS